ncbi:hypothetical protein B0T09DRAFT_360193 [Sordaria sp. MPI-SDFR-AT-0083]|nr:hypothetical protein B0T09DRAFT_360193 [Sordaria sp. MPI-SDFR-AT-0083]
MRMLTINKSAQYGYRSVHDLPTPPSTSRPSPPLISQDFGHKTFPAITHSGNQSSHSMSAPHRGLPMPAAMNPVLPPPGPGLVQQPPPPVPSLLGHSHPPPAPSQSQSLGQIPAPPSWQHGNEESMRVWLMAKAEEEKRKQEEEKTRQESFRLEQRKTEFNILRESLQGGVPPAMVPVVFAGMSGGALPQAALDWAQQYIYSQSHQPHPQALLPPGPISPQHQRRESQPHSYAHYPGSGGVPSTPGSAQGHGGGYMSGYPGSPQTRPRGQSVPGPMAGRLHGGMANLPNLNTNISGGHGGSAAAHPAIAQSQQQQEPQQSPSILFHHWTPPTSQAGGRSGADQPATPSGESPRKRKATGPQTAAPPPSSAQRFRSPTFSHSGAPLSNPPAGRKRGHSRQRSDLGSYRGAVRGRGDSYVPSPQDAPKDSGDQHQHQQHSQHHQHQHGQGHTQSSQVQQTAPTVTRSAHSVSSLLSDHPQSPRPGQFSEGSRSSEEKVRGGAVGGSSATRDRDND